MYVSDAKALSYNERSYNLKKPSNQSIILNFGRPKITGNINNITWQGAYRVS